MQETSQRRWCIAELREALVSSYQKTPPTAGHIDYLALLWWKILYRNIFPDASCQVQRRIVASQLSPLLLAESGCIDACEHLWCEARVSYLPEYQVCTLRGLFVGKKHVWLK